jgi:hypothetical protein
VLKLFDKYCVPTKNYAVEMFKFNKIYQECGKSVTDLMHILKQQAKQCGFTCTKCKESYEETMLANQFIIGIRDDQIRRQLLQMGDSTLEEVYKYAVIAEMTRKQITELKTDDNQTEKTDQDVFAAKLIKKYDCKKCGRRHERMKCPAFGKKCKICGKLNHFAIGCFNKNKSQVIDSMQWHQLLIINNHNVKFKIDTGANINVLPMYILEKIQINTSLISKSRLEISAYGGFQFVAKGIIVLDCKYKNKFHKIHFIVANVTSEPVLGLQTCIDLQLIKRIDNISYQDEKQLFISKYQDIFCGLGKLPFKYDIQLRDDAVPVVKQLQRIPFSLYERLKFTLNDLEKQGVISKVTNPTDWVNNLVIIEKTNKSLRLCINPLHLNKYIKREYYNIPTCDEIVNKLSGKSVFSVIDMSNGFHQIELTKKSSYLCTFITPFGRYKFNRLPFGLSSSPEVFQRECLRIFGDIDGVSVYFDDLIIAANDEKEHDLILETVIERARKNCVKFNSEKLQYKKAEVKFLGFIFSKDGVKADPSKVESIKNLNVPKNVKQLQRLIGMVNFLNRFIPNLANLYRI